MLRGRLLKLVAVLAVVAGGTAGGAVLTRGNY